MPDAGRELEGLVGDVGVLHLLEEMADAIEAGLFLANLDHAV